MIFPSLFEELDLQRYVNLAEHMLPQRDIMIALCDESRQLIRTNAENKKLAEYIVKSDEREYVDAVNGGCGYVERKYNDVNVVYCHLGELAGLPVGELIFFDVGVDIDGEDDSAQKTSMLHSLAEIVKAELSYLYEVNVMATELGDRYDELSMLRSSDLELNEYHESRHILSTYIRSCAEHLNVDYASVWLAARQEIYPGGINFKHESTEVLSMLERLSIAAFELFKKGYEGFGINDKDEDLRRKIQLPVDKKVLLIPVFDAKNKPCGVLACLNEFYSKDFSNSDKSTLEAVSRKTYKYLASTQDEVTGLLNRKGFEESVFREILHKQGERYLVLFNLDQFKVVNAAYGMTTGDIVLSSVADIITSPSLGFKYASRLDADVFAAVLVAEECEVESMVREACHKIDAFTIPVDEKNLSVTSRAGVVAINSKETAISDHLYAAELALVNAKEDDDNQVVVYHPGNTALLKRKNQLTQVENIKQALEEDRFELYCQRIEPLSGKETHYEILVRMVDEAGELVFPDEFIPVAERYNLMSQIDRWIIKHSFKLLSKAEFRDIASNFKWGINLSGMTIGDQGFHEFVSDCLNEYGFQPTNLYFEITETAAIKNFQNCVAFMNKIHSLGVQFALDDFGSGLSSFSYLKKLSIDYLKIDGSLVKDVVGSRLDQTMISSISDIAKVLKVKTIAEYVENESILKMIDEMNIDFAQGYEIMKPRAIELELKSMAEHSLCKLSSGS